MALPTPKVDLSALPVGANPVNYIRAQDFNALLDYVNGKVVRVVNVKTDFGAVGDGVTNDRDAIQAALDFGAGQPIIVYLPPGTYKVWPVTKDDGQYPGNDCLRINYSNVTIVGAGRGLTTISCAVFNGQDPNTHWEVLTSASVSYVWRGNGIVLNGSTLSNIEIRSLRLTGNSPRNLTLYPVVSAGPGQSFPANVGTGEGWDLTHKAIIIGNGTTRNRVVMSDLEIDSWRGEIIYYGGSSGNQNMEVTRCLIHDCIGSMLSASGSMRVTFSEFYHGENAVENTPFGDEQFFGWNNIHDNKIGLVITSNAAAPTSGSARTTVVGNRVMRNWLGGLWVLGAIRGYYAYDNDVGDSSVNGDVLLGGSGGGSGPMDCTFENNVFRSESVYAGFAFRIACDSGYPIKNIRIVGNRTERSQVVKDGGGSKGGINWDLPDANATVYVERNDFSAGEPIRPGGTGAVELAVPYYGGSVNRNRFNVDDYYGNLDWQNGGTGSLSNVRPITPTFQIQPPSAGDSTLVSMSGSGVQAGQVCGLWVNGVAGESRLYIPATGTGWQFRRPYWIKSVSYPYRTALMLWVRWSGTVWTEQEPLDGIPLEDAMTVVWDIDPVPFPAPANFFWLSTETADSVAPNIPFFYRPRVTLAPTVAKTYTTFSNARPDVVLTVDVNANATIQNSATIKLAGGASFAPGGTGGVITFIRPASSSVIYELSRFAY